MLKYLSTASLIIANLLVPLSLFTFATGFFPYKAFLPGMATFNDSLIDHVEVPVFDKLIFMVVDALRRLEHSSYISHKSSLSLEQRFCLLTTLGLWIHSRVRSLLYNLVWSVTHVIYSLIRSGAALPFTAHASSPTITMPRIKAITTGSTPSFLDLILNFAESDTSSSLAHQDNWLVQLKSKQAGKLVMYGDDTWLKLFPGLFSRADGTSSFFVSVSGTRQHVLNYQTKYI